MAETSFYGPELAWVHHVGFGGHARQAGVALLRLVRPTLRTPATLVDLGCGSGIWAAKAERAGYSVIGVDCSAAMVRLARRESPGSRFIRSDLGGFSIPPCDLVTALGEVLNYTRGSSAIGLRRLFNRIAKALRPGGRFVFDVLVHEGEPMNYRTWRAGRDWVVLVEVAEDRRRRRVTREIQTIRRRGPLLRRSRERHTVRTFRQAEVEQALTSAGFGFRSSRRYGRYPLAPRRVAFIAVKPVHPRT